MIEIIHIKKTGEKLNDKGIDLLRKYGAPEGLLWLCEVQTIEECASYYGYNFIMNDLCKHGLEKGNTHIIYQHENGYICNSATFDPNNKKSFEQAAEWLAENI
jgi:hypothetical protein